ncbi:organic solute transporter Ostalpha-domain-containing protein [Cunninghamella echinulata]|nr:organic solute transporter Ostalpha-domain-containing protein [Cunninghamella echinulata]
MESGNSTAADSCPSPAGLRQPGLFGLPSFNLKQVWIHPTYNWHVIGWLVCLFLLILIFIICFTVIIKHLRNYYDPEIQRHKLRVLLYPPVYGVLAWFSYLRLDYATTILFFATLFEAFAVYNLYTCLQAYLAPFRIEAQGRKEPITTKVMFLFNVHLKSKFGMHFRIIIDILVFQYPIWAIIDALISVISQSKGYYCESSYSFQGTHVYLTIINFISLSIILGALFTYLAVFSKEFKRGNIPSHGMFWSIKLPIVIIFYIGEILLSILKIVHVIKGTDGTHSSDNLPWSADDVKSGIYVIVVCVSMLLASILMMKYFNVDQQQQNSSDEKDEEQYIDNDGDDDIQDTTGTSSSNLAPQKLSPWVAIFDAYLFYIPEFFRNVLCCGVDSYRLARKRVELRGRKKRTKGFTDSVGEHMLSNQQQSSSLNNTNTKESYYSSTTSPNVNA